MMKLFERLGQFLATQRRLWLFVVAISAPFCFVLLSLALRLSALRETEESLDGAALRARAALEKRLRKERFLQRYGHPEPYFIDHRLETLALLRGELQELRQWEHHPACPQRERAGRRIAFLEGPENHLAFAEEMVRSSKKIKETEEKLLHPVEVETEDLDRLLSIIEDIPIGSYVPPDNPPQLLIRDFLLVKKDPPAYELSLMLLKREFLP